MRKIALTLLAALFACVATAQNQVKVEISDGISNASLKQRIETQLSRLLTAVNTAERQSSDVNFSGLNISDMASQSLTSLWANARFRCVDDDIVEHGLALRRNGRIYQYQVRNIPVEMVPLDEAYTDDINQEVNICFDLTGKIVDFNISMDTQTYTRLMREGASIEDADERWQIIKFCEDFADAYRRKDMKYLEAVFSDDALIVTGKVVLRMKPEIGIAQKDYEYTKQTKAQYLANLRRIFSNPKTGTVNVQFKDYNIKRHGSKPNYYGVTLVQDWATDSYKDQGIVFLVWDFTDKEKPKIQVRTWQPMETDEDEVFTLNRFKLR